MQYNIAPQNAVDLLLSAPSPEIFAESAPLTNCAGRILAEDITAAIAIPPFDRSPYDGYAFIAADSIGASPDNPVTLRITEEIPAGKQPEYPITTGHAAKILTGGPIPIGADCTVKFETVSFDEKTVTLKKPVKPGDIVHAGEDVKAGAIIRNKGELITPSCPGLFVSAGLTSVSVYKRPRALILGTGSELIDPGKPLPPAKIYNSSGHTLIAVLNTLGIDAYRLDPVLDEPDIIAMAIKSAVGNHGEAEASPLPRCDILITTGGASVGDYDYSLIAAEKAGARVLFRKVDMRPGGAMIASTLNGRLILSLSGNPGSALMSLLMIARPYLMRLTGRRDIFPEAINVPLKNGLKKSASVTRYIRGKLIIEDGAAYFLERGEQGGGVLSSFTDCDLIAEIPPADTPITENTLIKVYRV